MVYDHYIMAFITEIQCINILRKAVELISFMHTKKSYEKAKRLKMVKINDANSRKENIC